MARLAWKRWPEPSKRHPCAPLGGWALTYHCRIVALVQPLLGRDKRVSCWTWTTVSLADTGGAYPPLRSGSGTERGCRLAAKVAISEWLGEARTYGP